MGENEHDLLRALGKLIKQTEQLGEDIRRLEEQRVEEIDKINSAYFPQMKTKRAELLRLMKEIDRKRTLARFGPDDEELALGKSFTGASGRLSPSPEFRFAMKEMMDELGTGKDLSNFYGDERIDDCLYTVPDKCINCTGGGGT